MKPIAIIAQDASSPTRPSTYPEPFATRMAGREKRKLGLKNFARLNTMRRPTGI